MFSFWNLDVIQIWWIRVDFIHWFVCYNLLMYLGCGDSICTLICLIRVDYNVVLHVSTNTFYQLSYIIFFGMHTNYSCYLSWKVIFSIYIEMCNSIWQPTLIRQNNVVSNILVRYIKHCIWYHLLIGIYAMLSLFIVYLVYCHPKSHWLFGHCGTLASLFGNKDIHS